ncbi:hypothetical protein ASG01_08325 [Chryseobacterium sp. Leaf180]|uniref:hypothetical protein n=1 Tax=Chryseobacterium sp. Leaf180 TaxID=1736289 RepID=UPI0006F53FF9|nr:hypothetical protein [Chryseobacterium sp. Leaf180]KQR93855.1 hypothetical protein ASG01_08325 [Chryseobacterium sp. Leaf180]
MKSKEYYQQIKKNGENVFEVYLKHKKTLSPLESMKEMRKDFPQITFEEAKEIMIICDTNFNSIEEYQGSILDDIKRIIEN